MLQTEIASRIVDTKLRPIAVNPNEVMDEEMIYVDAVTDHVLLEVGDKRIRLTKLGAKELALRLIEQI